MKTGTNAAPSAESATSARTRFGTWNATVNALIDPCTPKNAAATISRSTPDDPAETGRDREQRSRDRQATPRGGLERRGGVGLGHRARIGTRPAGPGLATGRERPDRARFRGGARPSRASRAFRSALQGHSGEHQAAEEARQGLRPCSGSRTCATARRSRRTSAGSALPSTPATRTIVAAEHRALVRLIDRAGAKRALHPNTAARKKSNAARLVTGGSPRAGQQATRHAQGSLGDSGHEERRQVEDARQEGVASSRSAR